MYQLGLELILLLVGAWCWLSLALDVLQYRHCHRCFQVGESVVQFFVVVGVHALGGRTGLCGGGLLVGDYLIGVGPALGKAVEIVSL